MRIGLDFIDSNTIKITLNDVEGDFEIKSENKVLHVSVE